MFFPWRKSSFFLLFNALVFLTSTAHAQNCPKVIIRRAWVNLPPADQTAYLNAVEKFMRERGTDYVAMAKLHSDLASANPSIHGTTYFLPWHRIFLLQFEQKIGLPACFWDSSANPNTFASQSVFYDTAFGSAGGDNVACISSGRFMGLQLPGRGCIRRGGVPNFQRTVPATAFLNNAISNSQTFAQICESLEYGYHGDVHIAVGGDMSSMLSPLDPLFYMHHCNVDRLWAIWQQNHPNVGYTDVTRFNQNYERLTTQLPRLGRTIGDAMRISNLCYNYAELVPAPTPTPGPAPTPTPGPAPTPTPGPAPTPGMPPYLWAAPGLPAGKCINKNRMPAQLLLYFQQNPQTIQFNLGLVLQYCDDFPPPQPPPQPVQNPNYWYAPGLDPGWAIDIRLLPPGWYDLLQRNAPQIILDNKAALRAYMVQPGRLRKRDDYATPTSYEAPSEVAAEPAPELPRLIIPPPLPKPVSLEVMHRPEHGVLCLGEVASISVPLELPEHWIEKNHLDPHKVREYEEKRKQLAQKLNELPGFVRSSSIIHKRNRIKKLLDNNPGLRKVTFYVKKKKIEVDFKHGSAATADRIIAAYQREIKQHRKPKIKDLAAIIGKPAFGVRAISNPFRTCEQS